MSEEPYFRLHAFICINERAADDPRGCCAARGGVELRDHLKKSARQSGIKGVRINNAGCLDRCALGPVLVVYPEAIWYGVDTAADIDEIVASHLVAGRPVERLRLAPQHRTRLTTTQS